jgi:hypothetical protein
MRLLLSTGVHLLGSRPYGTMFTYLLHYSITPLISRSSEGLGLSPGTTRYKRRKKNRKVRTAPACLAIKVVP